ncbi:MAG TPA: DUF5678 domain-containing protein [Thermoleophilaceae bacterium]|jgi:hypothetical protein
MEVLEPPQIAQSPLPSGVAERYAGNWIAVRRREVIASSTTFAELLGDERVRDDDTLYHVPPPNSAFF